MNLRNLVCTAFLVNACGLVFIGETVRNLSIRLKVLLKNIRRIARKPSKINLLWLNILAWTYDHRIKWDEGEAPFRRLIVA
jgi:hypothetical protein